MLRVFCCRSRKASNVEEDRITDSLEACLSHELGVKEFQKFLVSKKLEDDTLQVFLECNRILREIDKLSPGGRAGNLPDHIQTAISNLYCMSQRINLDSSQLNALENLRSSNINVKIRAIQEVQNAAEGLMQDNYRIFRRWKLSKTSSIVAVLFIVLLNLQMCLQGNARRYFLDKMASKTNPENLHYEAEDHECYITVQETRRIGGQCVKIRDNFQGCVAGSLMDPFHQDCL